MPSLKDVFSQDYLRKLNSIKFNISQNHTGSFSGSRRSRAKGASLEFSDFRNYNLGDDIRKIDWNSYGRLDKLFVRVFEEERQANLNIFIDISSSMDFGEENKLFYSKVIAASIAYIAFSSSDNVNIFTLNNKLELNIKNYSAKNMLGNMLDFLDGVKCLGETDFSAAFNTIGKYHLRPGLSVVISDFLTDKGFEDALLKLTYKKQRVCAMQVLSKEEAEPELSGGIRLLDMENHSALDIEIDEFVLDAYKKELHKHISNLEVFCKSKGIEYILAHSDIPYYQYLTKIIR